MTILGKSEKEQILEGFGDLTSRWRRDVETLHRYGAEINMIGLLHCVEDVEFLLRVFNGETNAPK